LYSSRAVPSVLDTAGIRTRIWANRILPFIIASLQGKGSIEAVAVSFWQTFLRL
jgi:hypothetical protein